MRDRPGMSGPGSEMHDWRRGQRLRTVATVGAAAEVPQARPVLVGYDGSLVAEATLEWALGEALVCGAPVHVVTVWSWDWPPSMARHGPHWERGEAPAGRAGEHQQAAVARALARFGRPAPSVTGEITEGDPAARLIQRSTRARLLVLGRHRKSQVPLSGSVTDVCVRHARCPVVVVPAGD